MDFILTVDFFQEIAAESLLVFQRKRVFREFRWRGDLHGDVIDFCNRFFVKINENFFKKTKEIN